ncbi:ATP-binding protein [Candidatus Palauibacter sp.]|uniref:ATP-binding protein n=1 Tax=Candidatus Palauibacter sp. TaxID=3101350 RepID=UPI003AF2A7A8
MPANQLAWRSRIRYYDNSRTSRRTETQDERLLNEKRRYGDTPFDAEPLATADIDHLDLRRFEEEYLPQAVNRAVLESNDRSLFQRLAATKMVATAEDPTPTVTGIPVLGTRPQDFLPGAYVQFLRIAGTALADDIADEARCDGPIMHMMRRLDEKLSAHNRTAVDITSGRTDRHRSTYPLQALQQLARNAVMHRAYDETNAPVHVYWFDDRIETGSPGGPYGGVTIANFGQPGIVSYRNPNLAEAMRALGLVQRYGVGIPIARRTLSENGQPEPAFNVNRQWVSCIVGARP